MLALAVTFLVISFLLGPDLLSRWILGFIVPRRSLSQNRGEEITRAIIWVVGPLFLTAAWVWFRKVLKLWGTPADVQIFVSGLYSTVFFDAHTQSFFQSLGRVAGMYWSLTWRLYVIVILLALALNLAISNFRQLRNWLKSKRAKAILATIVLPRVSEWHVLFSDMLLPKEDVAVAVDVLTKSSILYQGGIQDRMLGTDGSLQSLTLSEARRFLREDFHKAKEADPKAETDEYWRSIPGKLFVIMGSDISSVNFRYQPRVSLSRVELSEQELTSVRELLSKLRGPEQKAESTLTPKIDDQLEPPGRQTATVRPESRAG